MKSLRQRIKTIAVKSVIAGSGLIASGMSVSAYTWAGMDNLSTFLSDVVQLIPNLIPLVVVGTIIAVVYKFRDFIGRIIKL